MFVFSPPSGHFSVTNCKFFIRSSSYRKGNKSTISLLHQPILMLFLKGAFSISWIMEYDQRICVVIKFSCTPQPRCCGVCIIWSCEVLRHWRTKTIQTAQVMCCKGILSMTIFFFFWSVSLNALQRGFLKKGCMSYNTKYMVASVWLPAPSVLLNWLHFSSFFFLLVKTVHTFSFVFCTRFTIVVSLLRMQTSASKSFPLFA